jgi:hypothetical protein
MASDSDTPRSAPSPSEVAAMLGISPATVQRHITEIDSYSRWQMAQVASVLTDDE